MKSYKVVSMSLLSLILVSSAFVTSVRNLTTIAATGMTMFFFSAVAALCFFIPVALVSAELATGWPEKGGVYAWVKAAFGERWGFFAVWFQWSYAIFGVVSTLYFASSAFAYVLFPGWSHARWFLILISLFITWFFTIASFYGQRVSSAISGVGFTVGVLLPALLIVVLGGVYLLQGNVIQLNFDFTWQAMLPNFHHITSLVLLVGFIRAFGGIEASASHASEVVNPRRNYPIAIFIVVCVGLAINLFGSISVATVIPTSKINLASGVIDAFAIFLSKFHLAWLIRPLALMLTLGAMGSVSTWLMGPIKGVLATAENGDLPPLLQRKNKQGAPYALLLIQAVVISVVVSGLLLVPNLNIGFWASIALAMVEYLVMYILLLLSGLVLRYKAPRVHRQYRVPFGKLGIWLVVLVGVVTLVCAFILNLLPPEQLIGCNPLIFTMSLGAGAVVMLALPLWIFSLRKS